MSTIYTEQIAPCQVFVDSNGLAIPVKQVALSLTKGSTNQLILAGVTGKRIRVISLVLSCYSGISWIEMRDGSGGAYLLTVAVQTSVGPSVVLPFNKAGWLDTSAGVGIYANTGTDTPIVSLSYIEYTQVT